MLLPEEERGAELKRLEALQKQKDSDTEATRKRHRSRKVGFRITVSKCVGSSRGRGRHDFVYWSGVLVLLVQLLAFGVPPLSTTMSITQF
jgi:hypothetical protein